MSTSVDPNVTALTVSIQQLVAQLLAGGNISAATTSIKDAIEVSVTHNATDIYDLTASTADAAASAKVSADAATARSKSSPTFSLHPSTHDADGILN